MVPSHLLITFEGYRVADLPFQVDLMQQDSLAKQEGLARRKPAWSWRDEGRTVLVFALAETRGEELKSLNRRLRPGFS